MHRSNIVIVGNQYLKNYAIKSGAKFVALLPSVVDIDSFSNIKFFTKASYIGVPFFYIIWVGTPSTEKYLNLLCSPLREISKKYNIILRVISHESKLRIDGVNIEHFNWNESSVVDYINNADIGIMPLTSTPWELGKCGYKLIQYMACSLPVIASNVGANKEIVEDGISGFLVNNSEEWVQAFQKLLDNKELRHQMGSAGRVIVENRYCTQVSNKKLIKLLQSC